MNIHRQCDPEPHGGRKWAPVGLPKVNFDPASLFQPTLLSKWEGPPMATEHRVRAGPQLPWVFTEPKAEEYLMLRIEEAMFRKQPTASSSGKSGISCAGLESDLVDRLSKELPARIIVSDKCVDAEGHPAAFIVNDKALSDYLLHGKEIPASKVTKIVITHPDLAKG